MYRSISKRHLPGLFVSIALLCSIFSLRSSTAGQDVAPSDPRPTSDSSTSPIARAIANQKRMEGNLELFERIERVEIRKQGNDANPIETKVMRVFPSGPAMSKILLSPTGEPINSQSYRAELEKLLKYLTWVVQDGAPQHEAYAKAEHKRKERGDLIASTRDAFVFTRLGTESRGERTLVKYSMQPNPTFRPTTRNAMIFSKIRGTVWIDEHSGELAKIEGRVTEDISIALFLAKVYKGSHFMQERYEFFPGIWFPSYEQYDFDGRRFLVPFAIHEITFYSAYKRVGSPSEALTLVRAELDKLASN